MLRLFIATFIAGALLAVAVAAVWPMPGHLRHPSITEVEPDGGRREEFSIQWPEDRLVLPADARAGDGALVRAAAGIRVLEDASGRRASAELFRVRNARDEIVGIGARLAGTGGAVAAPGRSVSGWVLVIPSRGALFLAHDDDRDLTAREARTNAGEVVVRGPQSRLLAMGQRQTVGAAGRIRAGTGEFARLGGRYSETWEAAPADPGSGRVVLSTITVQEP